MTESHEAIFGRPSADLTRLPAAGAEGRRSSLTATVTATTTTTGALTQPSTATYYQHVRPELGSRYT
jgi:hypothetical protein